MTHPAPTPLIPETYEQWHHCITVLCNQPLTPDFIESRLNALVSERDHMTQRFVELYGDAQRQKTLVWLKQAQAAL